MFYIIDRLANIVEQYSENDWSFDGVCERANELEREYYRNHRWTKDSPTWSAMTEKGLKKAQRAWKVESRVEGVR